jgi:hypothetical protein
VTSVASKVTLHPASHNCPMDISDLEARSGTMWTCRAASGKSGYVELSFVSRVHDGSVGVTNGDGVNHDANCAKVCCASGISDGMMTCVNFRFRQYS